MKTIQSAPSDWNALKMAVWAGLKFHCGRCTACHELESTDAVEITQQERRPDGMIDAIAPMCTTPNCEAVNILRFQPSWAQTNKLAMVSVKEES